MNAQLLPSVTLSKSVAALRKTSGKDALRSARGVPTALPGTVNLAMALSAGVNGSREIGIQRAAVEYLSTDRKMTLPEALFLAAPPNNTGTDTTNIAHLFYNTTISLMGLVPDHRSHVVTQIRTHATPNTAGTGGAAAWAGAPETWNTYCLPGASTDTKYIKIQMEVGNWADDGAFTPRASRDEDAYAMLFIKYGAADEDCFTFAVNIVPSEESPTTPLELLNLENVISLYSDQVSIIYVCNYSVKDHGFLMNQNNRWPDAKCQDPLDDTTFRPKIGAHTMSMIAALNLGAVNGDPILAWVRSYGISCGMLPAAPPLSLHNVEYNITPYMPEDAEVLAIAGAHPVGDEGRKFMRGCMSILAGFGMLHLANDHTYKPSDEHLKRKGKVVVECIRTIFDESIISRLKADGMLEHSVRTACHPFGLSSTWAIFQTGQKFNFISEPLCDRTTTLPPTVARVGLVCAIMEKIIALPIGGLVKKAYATQFAMFQALRTTVVSNATAYSNLHKHYGIDAQLTLTTEQEAAVNSLRPFVAAYALTFEKDSDGNPKGAALSPIILSIQNDADVIMYRQAFATYAENSEDLKTLIGDVSASSSAAVAP